MEIHELVDSFQKIPWYIYVDRENYYLVQTQSLVPGFSINSRWAVKYGAKIPASSRVAYESILAKITESKKSHSPHLNSRGTSITHLKRIADEIQTNNP